MDKDFEIEIQEEQAPAEQSVQLPLNFLTFGEIENDDVKVYIKQDVYKELEKLAQSDTSKELGSILFGFASEEMGKTHVVISDFVEAKYTDASASTLTFTHETWDYVHGQQEKRFPQKKMMGWQHTHPNYGIFLSNYDMFIQENFFNLPFQIAYVIDPIQNLRGFFQWKNGRVEKLKGFYVYDEVGKPIKLPQTKVKKQEGVSVGTFKAASALIALLCVATALLAILSISLNGKYKALQRKQAAAEEQVQVQTVEKEEDPAASAQQQELIQNQADAISKLQALLDKSGDGKATAAQLIELLENNDLALKDQAALIDSLKALAKESPAGDVTFKSYTVSEGDSLWKICAENDLDYGASLQVILALNGIENPDHIRAGQTILLPVASK